MTTKQTPGVWHKVDSVYQATDEIKSTEAVRTEKLRYEDSETGTTHWSGPMPMFSCQLYHKNGTVDKNDREGRPTISPYAENQVVLPATQVFLEREDYLLLLRTYENPLVHDPGEEFRSRGGKKHVEMVLIRHKDVGETNFLTDLEWKDLQTWRLGDHPFVRLHGDGSLTYRVIEDVWWLILTPYHVPILKNASWERTRLWRSPWWKPSDPMKPREVENQLTKKLVERLPELFGMFDGKV